MNYTFFDIECANCFQGRGKMCSFGYVITDENFNVLKMEDIVIDPHAKFHLDGRANRPGIVLAYDEETFRSAPRFPHFYNKIRNLLTDENSIVFGFSVMSDASFIKSECERYRKEIFDYDFFDVQRIYTDMHELKNTPSLIKCASEYGVTETQSVHKSDEDALFTMQVMKGMCESTGMSPIELTEKYMYCKCRCKDGVLETDYTKYKELMKAQKLSWMEQATNSHRSNWTSANEVHNEEFDDYHKKVFVNYKSDSQYCGKKLCISNLYEDFHFNEMMNIVSLLAPMGVRYTKNPFNCDIFVKIHLDSKKGTPFPCYRRKKAMRAVNQFGKEIEFINFNNLLEMIGKDEQKLSVLDKENLSPVYVPNKTPSTV